MMTGERRSGLEGGFAFLGLARVRWRNRNRIIPRTPSERSRPQGEIDHLRDDHHARCRAFKPTSTGGLERLTDM